jgi:hypothetical protein
VTEIEPGGEVATFRKALARAEDPRERVESGVEELETRLAECGGSKWRRARPCR